MTTAIETAPADPASPPAIQNPQSRIQNWTPLILLGLTLVGGVLRLSFLDRPPLWFDESMTFMRVSGTYQQLLDRLEEDGFAPLHYQLYWVIRQWHPLTPFMMRLVPAICGTLMIPVMYWLAVQIVSRRAALVTAIFTAFSAYLLGYSRDAKMYSDFWFFCALSAATLLWWLRVRTLTSWLCWVASSAAMLGIHSVGAGILGIELLIVLTARPGNWRSLAFVPVGVGAWPIVYAYPFARRYINPAYVAPKWRVWNWLRNEWRRFCCPPVLAFGAGVLVITAGPYGYYKFFNQYAERVERAGWMGTGIQWVSDYNRGRQAIDLVQYTATAYLYNWEWPRKFEKPRIDEQAEVNPRTLRLLKWAGISLGSLLLLGALPWPRRWRGDVAPHAPDSSTTQPSSWWRPAMWICAWLIIPAYAGYVASARAAASPVQWFVDVLTKESPKITWPFFPRAQKLADSWKLWTETDSIRKFFASWGAALQQSASAFTFANVRWWLVALLLILATSHIFISASTWRARLSNIGNLLRVAATIFVICLMIHISFGAPLRGSVWMPRYLGFVWPAFAMAVAVLLCRLPTWPLRWAAIALLVGINLSVFTARVFAGSEPPVDRMARDLLDAQPDGATFRMYYGISQMFNGAPGYGVLQLVPGRYYLSVYSGRPTNPREMMSGIGQISDKFKRWPRVTSLAIDTQVVVDVSKNPQLTRIVLWDKFDRTATEYPDKLGPKLGASWKLARSEIFKARDHWTWRDLYQVRRREYERVGPPATQATTAPTTTAPTTKRS